jgi:ankyrin repeat protein
MPQDTELHKAAKDGDVDRVKELLDSGAQIDALGAQGRTPLHRALGGGFLECACLLLDRGADPHIIDSLKRTSLHWAVLGAGEVMACVEQLFIRNAGQNMVNSPSKSKSTPLHCAISAQRLDVARYLLEKHANPHLQDEDEKSCFALAKECGLKDLFRNSNDHRRSSRGAGGMFGIMRRGSAKKEQVHV